MKKRFLAVILALVMCVGLAPTAFAADSDFVIENGVLTKYNGPGGEVVIPDGVVCIGNGAFKDCTSMTSVIIPDSVTGIGYINKYSSDGGAFEGCTGLTSITIPDGVTNLTDDVFRDCTALTSITLPVSVEWFTVWLFSGTGLTDIYYAGSPEQWKQIGLGDSMQGWGTIGYPYDPTYGVLLDPFDCLGLVGDVTIHYNSGGPQPSVPAQPEQKPSTPAANKPAPGVSVSLNDGSGEFIYTIKSGDTLSGIAAYYYGDADVYKLIFERNKDVLKSASAVYAGQAIILPSYAAVAAFQAAK